MNAPLSPASLPLRSTVGKYRVTAYLGGGVEGHAFRVVCRQSGQLGTLKVYAGGGAVSLRTAHWQAKRLRSVADVVGVPRARDLFVESCGETQLACLVTDYARGQSLQASLDASSRKVFRARRAVRVTYSVARVVAELHARRAYHGDIHTENVVLSRSSDRVQLIDFYRRPGTLAALQREDIRDTVGLLFRCVGGKARYPSAPKYVKQICGGMRRDVIHRRYPTARRLAEALGELVD